MKDKSFTIRLPEDLVDQIDMRCEINHRSRTKEIHALGEYALDHLVQDHKAAAAIKVGTTLSDQPQSSEADT